MNMIRISFLIMLFSSSICLAQEGDSFPDLEGITLEDESVSVPNDTKDKVTLVGLAYSKKAEEDLETWMNPVYQTFIYKPDKPQMFRTEYDVNLYFVPMFTGANTAVEGTVRNKMKKSVDAKLHGHILFYKGALKEYKEQLSLDKKDTPYFFVIDTNGKIIHTTSGAYTDEKMEEIEALLEED